MRDIKFRAWDKNRKGFINGFNMIGFSTGQGAPKRKLKRFSNEWNEEDIELMQYTGLKDDEEKEIYEGDVIQFTWEENSCWGKAGTYKGYVRFKEGVFEVVYIGREKITISDDGGRHVNSTEDDIRSLMSWSEDIEIIGDIYKNPELLEGQK